MLLGMEKYIPAPMRFANLRRLKYAKLTLLRCSNASAGVSRGTTDNRRLIKNLRRGTTMTLPCGLDD